MAEISQFGGAESQGLDRDCLHTEAMLADVLDNALSPEDQARFDLHLQTCPSCAGLLADARRGAAWLDMLRPHRPEPSIDLVARILTNTSLRAAAEPESAKQAHRAAIPRASLLASPAKPTVGAPFDDAANPLPAGAATVLPFPPRFTGPLRPTLGSMLQTRMAMTAAMAFVSIALTFNLLDVHVTALRARDLTPSSLRRDASETNARIVRYYESLRVVYELESRVHDLQHGSAVDVEPQRPFQSTAPDSQPQPDQPAGDPANKSAPDKSAPDKSAPAKANPKPDAPAPKSVAPQSPPHEPRSSSILGIHGRRQTDANARRSLPSLLPLGPTLPVVFRPHAPSLKKGVSA